MRIAKFGSMFLAAFLMSMFLSMGCTRVGAGYVGIKVNMAGSNRGVEDYPAQTGWVFYNPLSTSIFHYPTFVQTAKWTKSTDEGSPVNEEVSFNTKDSMTIYADVSLSYQLDPLKVPHFYVKFRSDKLDGFTHGYLRNVARDAFNEVGTKYTVEEIYGPKREDFIEAVKSKINNQVKEVGVEIQQFGFIGAPRPPQVFIDAVTAKITATQNAMRAENELRQTEAEAKKKIAAAEGDAQSNKILSSSIDDKLLTWRKMQLTQEAIAKWDGKRPQVEGGNAGLLINIDPKQ